VNQIDHQAIPRELFIGGAWRPSSSGLRVDVVDPTSTRVLCDIADAEVEDGLAAVDAAEKALDGWRARAPRERAEILRRCHTLMMERAEWFAALISDENGKALDDARGEVAYAAEFFRWYAEEAVRNNGELNLAPGGSNRILVQYQPIGVSLLVTPWNFPAAMATRKIAPALAAGCSVILKPATETPLTALAMVDLFAEAGVPDGVVNVITTTRSGPVVDAILHDPRVRKLSFTGSTEVGRILLREAADHVVSCSMELGGNGPFLVFDDADLPTAIDAVMLAKMRNGGQACTAANRIFVQDGIHDRFVAALSERMAALTVGAPRAEGTQVGPLVDVPSLTKVEELVADAVDKGAQIVTGGGRPDIADGYFYRPTVLDDVSLDARISREEVFGPVAAIYRFTQESEAIAAANDTELGLAAYVLTGDLARGLRVSERLEVGMVGLNRGLVSDPAAPFGGVKESGLGREGSHHGLREFCEAKYIAVDW
jgi:succinate-semialdehyde dehydrogenase/glutarate-semialdehyde dehydrogenase